MSERIVVSLCTNNPRNGDDTGRVSAVHLDDEAIELAWGEIGSEPRYSFHGDSLGYSMFLGRKRFRVLGKTDWYGNWCWTGVPMEAQEVVKLLNHLSKDDRWHCEGGWCDLTDAFTDGKVTLELLQGRRSGGRT